MPFRSSSSTSSCSPACARILDTEVIANVDLLTRACFLVALAALGLQTRMAHVRVLGPRPFLLGLGTSGVVAAGSLALILVFGLGPTRTSVASPTDPAAFSAKATPALVPTVELAGRVLATGVRGAGALSAVGRFHPGGPLHDSRKLATMTRAGDVLDADRLLVASTSNYGAPLARTDWAGGSVLSLATDASGPLAVPPRFASAGGQARALGGDVQVLAAQSPAFVNRLTTPGAETADLPAVATPTGISVSNAFGRPSLSNAAGGGGLESVIDPDGRPLADAPSEHAGGVFAGTATDRRPQRLRGSLSAPALGNAFLGASPDASGRAVFAVATADGALQRASHGRGCASAVVAAVQPYALQIRHDDPPCSFSRWSWRMGHAWRYSGARMPAGARCGALASPGAAFAPRPQQRSVQPSSSKHI